MISKQGIGQTRIDVATAISDVATVQSEVDNINGDSIPAMVGTDSAFLANVGGLLTTAAATGAVSNAKLLMAYAKQLVTEGIARDTAIGNIPTTMVGTNNAALASAWTSALATALGSYTAVKAGYLDELDFDLQGLLNTIAAYLTTEIADILTDTGTTIPGLLSTIQTDLDNPSQYMANLSTLETRLSSARAGYLDELSSANLPTDVAALNTLLGRVVHRMVFWSEVDDLITIDAAAGAEVLPSVVVAEIPAGAVILRVNAILSIGAFEDTSGSENKVVLAGTEHIQVKETAGGTFQDAIKMLAGMWLTGASAVRGGLVMIGNLDIAGEVNANDTYDFQIEGADVTAASLLLRDVQTGLIVYFTLE